MGGRFRRLRVTVAGWIVGGLLAGVAILPLCDLHFDCGCTWPGLGGYSHCDIHVSGPPDCPWCADIDWWIGEMLAGYGLALAACWVAARRARVPIVALISFATVFLAGLVAGVVTSLVLGLPVLAGLR